MSSPTGAGWPGWPSFAAHGTTTSGPARSCQQEMWWEHAMQSRNLWDKPSITHRPRSVRTASASRWEPLRLQGIKSILALTTCLRTDTCARSSHCSSRFSRWEGSVEERGYLRSGQTSSRALQNKSRVPSPIVGCARESTQIVPHVSIVLHFVVGSWPETVLTSASFRAIMP